MAIKETLANTPPARVAKEAQIDIMEILEPHFIYHQVGGREGIHPRELRGQVYTWDENPLGAIVDQLDMYRIISPETYQNLLAECHESIKYSLLLCFDPKTGGFYSFVKPEKREES